MARGRGIAKLILSEPGNPMIFTGAQFHARHRENQKLHCMGPFIASHVTGQPPYNVLHAECTTDRSDEFGFKVREWKFELVS